MLLLALVSLPNFYFLRHLDEQDLFLNLFQQGTLACSILAHLLKLLLRAQAQVAHCFPLHCYYAIS